MKQIIFYLTFLITLIFIGLQLIKGEPYTEYSIHILICAVILYLSYDENWFNYAKNIQVGKIIQNKGVFKGKVGK